MYCCNISCIALSASHVYSHRGIRRIRNAFTTTTTATTTTTTKWITVPKGRQYHYNLTTARCHSSSVTIACITTKTNLRDGYVQPMHTGYILSLFLWPPQPAENPVSRETDANRERGKRKETESESPFFFFFFFHSWGTNQAKPQRGADQRSRDRKRSKYRSVTIGVRSRWEGPGKTRARIFLSKPPNFSSASIALRFVWSFLFGW